MAPLVRKLGYAYAYCSIYGASLPRVTSQAWLRSDLEPLPGVTAGESRMFLALGVLDR